MDKDSRAIDSGVDEVEVRGSDDGGENLAIGANGEAFEGCAVRKDMDGLNRRAHR